MLPLYLAKKGSLTCALETPVWPEYKANTVFGQLPQLEWDGGKMAQSMAIARFISRKAGMDGKSDEDFRQSEMLLELMVEVYDTLKAAHVYNLGGTPAEKVPELATTLRTLFKHMNGMVDASRGTAGDYACVAACISCDQFDLNDILADAPKVKALYEAEKAVVDELFGAYGAWFKPLK